MLSHVCIRRPVMTAVLTVSVILFGVLSYLRLPVNDLPAVDYPVIQVQVDYPGASPDPARRSNHLSKLTVNPSSARLALARIADGIAAHSIRMPALPFAGHFE